MPAPADLVHEASVSTGTGVITLTVLPGRQTFAEAFTLGGTDVFRYYLSSKNNLEWETGTGHLLNATTLVRDTVIKSSNSDALVNFSAGTMDVTNDVGADNVARLDGDQTFTGEKKFEQTVIEINSIGSPTDANADGGGLILLATTDKSILFDNPEQEWFIEPGLRSPIVDVTAILTIPSGQLTSTGIDINQDKVYQHGTITFISEDSGNIVLSNIGEIDSVTKATIENAINALPNLTSIGGSSIDGPSGTWDLIGMNLAATGIYRIGGVDVIEDFVTGISLKNIASLDSVTETTVEDAIDALPNLATIQGQTIELINANADAFFGWDDSVSKYENLTPAEARLIIGLATLSLDGLVEFATSAEFQSNSSNVRALESNEVWDAQAEVALTSTSNSVAWDMSTGFNFDIDTLGEDTTIANPTNVDVGKSGHLRIVQDGTGTRTVAFGSNFEFAGGTAPTASTDPAAEDMFFYKVISATRILVSSILDIS